MLFNSFAFILAFLPLMLIVYFLLYHWKLAKAAKLWLLAGSLFFYGWWNLIYLPLLMASITLNYGFGRLIRSMAAEGSRRKYALAAGIVFNVALLAYYKYTDFFIGNLNSLFGTHWPLLQLILPLAISFHTFQQIAFLVDTYREEIEETSFLNYFLFVSFFPQLIAGPIVHHREMMPQFAERKNRQVNTRALALGIVIFVVGLFKKVVIADKFAVWANHGFDVAPVLTLFEAWIVSLSYTLQLYFDFSGYSDMAIGIALMFNIRLPDNFHSPYKALDIQDFWRRWHMTLGRFLTRYIYIPLGGNRRGEARTYAHLFLVFLISGLWHGAGWTFICWGAMHGAAIVIHRYWKSLRLRMPVIPAWMLTFAFVNIAWVFFRAKEWGDAIKVLKGLFGLNGIWLPAPLLDKLSFLSQYGVPLVRTASMTAVTQPVLMIVIGMAVVLLARHSGTIPDRFKPTFAASLKVAGMLVLALAVMYANRGHSEFIYFNF